MTGLKPFFCYYGGKWRGAKRYPEPLHDLIIEPFAGAAGYATRYHHKQVKLFDLDSTICGLWSFLISVSSSEISSLPLNVMNVEEHPTLIPEAKHLIGFWLNKASVSPRKAASTWYKSGLRPNSYWGETIRARIAYQVDHIRHWQVHNASYTEAQNETATWFVDPPYQGKAGALYNHRIDSYSDLSAWCRSREGQAVVCEAEGATWLPFRSLGTFKANAGPRGKQHSKEALWTK